MRGLRSLILTIPEDSKPGDKLAVELEGYIEKGGSLSISLRRVDRIERFTPKGNPIK